MHAVPWVLVPRHSPTHARIHIDQSTTVVGDLMSVPMHTSAGSVHRVHQLTEREEPKVATDEGVLLLSLVIWRGSL